MKEALVPLCIESKNKGVMEIHAHCPRRILELGYVAHMQIIVIMFDIPTLTVLT